MIATAWVISQSIISFTKNKNPDAGEIDQLEFNRFQLYTSIQLITSIYLKSII